ncbi:hypothetical protein CEE37_05190 [candidate division LCP-89 bacterium B3_LCP]|uniref:HNH endonuclease 5 domain-containing protein n=1 Tax=candidate division LCP-89 bacterium B3_LCP TaxID=2012998 RepID=A0A532V1Q1_UNCL8|nr:MAG: hypothetical protein CEE37_05190 [candidate division LCP-89 bacterium B3_LCP]
MVCKLCQNERKLVNSHIIPEFMYKPLYDEKHRFIRTSTDPNENSRTLQKGLKERLLCEECDSNKIGKWEDYVSRLIFQRSTKPEYFDNATIFQGVEYNKFKLFQLSLLWRSSVSNLIEFKHVDLSSSPHEEHIRKMLLADSPGRHYEYGCLIIFPENKQMRQQHDVILPPEKFRMESFRGYRFNLNGLFWHYITSKHSDSFPFHKCFLREDGTLPIMSDLGASNEFYAKYAKELGDRGKLNL